MKILSLLLITATLGLSGCMPMHFSVHAFPPAVCVGPPVIPVDVCLTCRLRK